MMNEEDLMNKDTVTFLAMQLKHLTEAVMKPLILLYETLTSF